MINSIIVRVSVDKDLHSMTDNQKSMLDDLAELMAKVVVGEYVGTEIHVGEVELEHDPPDW